MKITKTKLKQIIKEELESVLENSPADNSARDIELLLDFTIDRIITTPYDEKDPNSPLVYKDGIPSALQKMADLIKARDYKTIRSDFNKMWSELVSYHRKLVEYYFENGKKKDEAQHLGGLKPRVSHNFRSINTIVRNLPLDMRT